MRRVGWYAALAAGLVGVAGLVTPDATAVPAAAPAAVSAPVTATANVTATATATWAVAPVLPAGRSHLAADTAGSTLYAAGGYDDNYADSATMYGYSAATRTWRTLPPMPRPRSSFALVHVGGYLYAVGGGLTSVDRYDLSTGRWQAGAVPKAPIAIGSAVARSDAGVLYALVATSDNRVVALKYDPARNAWTSSAPVALPGDASATFTAAVALTNGHILGLGAQQVDYDPAAGTWNTAVAAPTVNAADCDVSFDPYGARRGPDGRVYIMGAAGECTSAGGGVVGALAVYDPATGRWARGDTSDSNVSGQALVWYDNGLYAIGGDSPYELGTTDEVDRWSAAADTSAPTVTSAPRVRLTAQDFAGFLVNVGADAIPLQVSGAATDTSGAAGSTVRVAEGGHPYGAATLNFESGQLGQPVAGSAGIAVRAQMAFSDGLGNLGAYVSAPAVTPVLVDDPSSAIAYSGVWRTSSSGDGGIGGATRYTTALGASASFTFTGTSFAWADLCEVGHGNVRLYVDGKDQGTVGQDCSNVLSGGGTVLRALRWWPSAGTHTVRLVDTVAGAALDVDAFVYLR